MSRLETLLRQQERVQAQIDRLASRPAEPITDDVSVVYALVKFTGEKEYSYAFVRTVGGWFITGRQPVGGLTWDELLDRFDTNGATILELWVATEFERID